MPRGRRPKSNAEKELLGNPGKRKLSADKPVPPAAENVKQQALQPSEFAAPKNLPPYARDRWNYHIEQFTALGLLRGTDLSLLRMLCLNECEVEEMRGIVRREGYTQNIKSRHGKRMAEHKLLGRIDSKEKKIMAIYRDLCGTSASRIRTLATGISSRQYNLFETGRKTEEQKTGEQTAAQQPASGVENDDPVNFINRTKH